jgi:hypothetical protein
MSETAPETTPEAAAAGAAAADAVAEVQHDQAVAETAVAAAVIASDAQDAAVTAQQDAMIAGAVADEAQGTAEAAADVSVATAEATEEVAETVVEDHNRIDAISSSLGDVHSKLDQLLKLVPPDEPPQPEVQEVHVGSDTKRAAGNDPETASTGSKGTAPRSDNSRQRRHRFGSH